MHSFHIEKINHPETWFFIRVFPQSIEHVYLEPFLLEVFVARQLGNEITCKLSRIVCIFY